MTATSSAPNAPFDPLIDLDGLWTPELAERYLPISGVPPAKYECLDGKLIMRPREGSAATFAVSELGQRMKPAASSNGHHFYLAVNLLLGVQKWIEPDFAVLTRSGRGRVWIPPEDVLLVGECMSPAGRRNDRTRRPAQCSEANIPYFMRLEVNYADAQVDVELLRLEGSRYRPQARGSDVESFETDLPFPLAFDPAELLEP